MSWIIHIGDDIDETNKLAISSLAPRRGPSQISYYFALNEGTDIDQPRNLAKSVTVE